MLVQYHFSLVIIVLSRTIYSWMSHFLWGSTSYHLSWNFMWSIVMKFHHCPFIHSFNNISHAFSRIIVCMDTLKDHWKIICLPCLCSHRYLLLKVSHKLIYYSLKVHTLEFILESTHSSNVSSCSFFRMLSWLIV